jgi:arginyl-tRNA synthetase
MPTRLDVWADRSADNPVYYGQYVHARTCSLLGNAAHAGISRGVIFEPALLSHHGEADLLKDLGDFPAAPGQM